MMTVFNFDLSNPLHANAFAQVLALATQANVPMQVGVGGKQTNIEEQNTPTPTQKTYAPACDVACVWVVDGTKVSYELEKGVVSKDGKENKYVGQSGVRKTLNARLREGGATWDSEKKVWKFASKAKAETFAQNTSALVTADEIEEVRAKAQARAEKKAQKSA